MIAALLLVAVGVFVVVERRPRAQDEPADVVTAMAGTASLLPRPDVPGPEVPVPEECRVAPRSQASLQALAGTPPASPVHPAASPTPAVPPEGAPADAATVLAITATRREALACWNAGDYARAFALYSDAFVRRLLSSAEEQTHLPPDLIALALATPRPLSPAQWTALRAIGDVQLLADGRVGALVVTAALGQATPAAESPSITIFVKVGQRWLIDDVVAPPAAMGTPHP